ncbi:MAG: hypothetical protein M1839_007351 [Geoglossum umbratile]|nr:MAG: hypothetical protein M1839_007351 [Geoglossum umbratile]
MSESESSVCKQLPDVQSLPHLKSHHAPARGTLTVRIIKSFSYRTYKHLVIHDLDLAATTVGELKTKVKLEMASNPAWKAYRNVDLDTLKLYAKAQETKTMNLIINLDNDESLLFTDDQSSLASCGCEHETDVSFFKLQEYESFKANPEQKW